MEYYILPLYILFGFLPSLIWLLYYLSKDMHPEPKKMIIKLFLYGIVITIPVFFVQLFLSKTLQQVQPFSPFPIIIDVIKWFLIISFVEEIAKYLIVKSLAFKSRELDEPLDIMLYMVVVALGFASLENILYIFSPVSSLPFNILLQKAIVISFVRFIGATFLHTLCSALLGYFLAMSFFHFKNRVWLKTTGILLAVFLHGLYDFSIIVIESPINFIIPIVILMGLAIFIISQFDKVKKLKSICNL